MYNCLDCGATTNHFGFPFGANSDKVYHIGSTASIWTGELWATQLEEVCSMKPDECLHHDPLVQHPVIDGYW